MTNRPSRSVLRLLLLGVAATGFAVLAVVFAERHVAQTIARQQASAKVPTPVTVPVVVAKFDLIAGEAISADNMAIRQIPADLAPGSALRPDQFDAKQGMRLSRPLRSGEPLLGEILQAAEPGGLSMRVKQGIRAMTIAVDDVNAVSGMLRPGDRIDLLFSARPPGAEAASAVETTRVLVQDVPVLATGRQFRQAGEESAARAYTSITVELSPEDAKRLVVAQRTGRITALLRNPDDRHPISTSSVDAHALLGTAPVRSISVPLVPRRAGPEIIIGGSGPRTHSQSDQANAASVNMVAPGALVAHPSSAAGQSLAGGAQGLTAPAERSIAGQAQVPQASRTTSPMAPHPLSIATPTSGVSDPVQAGPALAARVPQMTATSPQLIR